VVNDFSGENDPPSGLDDWKNVMHLRAGQITLRSYADEWLARRPVLSVRTAELYRYLLSNHILPNLGHATLAALAPSKIRGWHAELSNRHPSTAAMVSPLSVHPDGKSRCKSAPLGLKLSEAVA
jgi:hypothetical protein